MRNLAEIEEALKQREQQVAEREKHLFTVQMEERIAAEEERMLQAALAASRGDPSNPPNPDLMSYEELLQLEDRNGRVCKGLSEEEIAVLEAREWQGRQGEEVSCSICFCALSDG